MKYVDTNSSAIAFICYEDRKLFIKFMDNSYYRYDNVHPDVWEGITKYVKSNRSLGYLFNYLIRPVYDYERLL